jgi:hypothetical protein
LRGHGEVGPLHRAPGQMLTQSPFHCDSSRSSSTRQPRESASKSAIHLRSCIEKVSKSDSLTWACQSRCYLLANRSCQAVQPAGPAGNVFWHVPASFHYYGVKKKKKKGGPGTPLISNYCMSLRTHWSELLMNMKQMASLCPGLQAKVI